MANINTKASIPEGFELLSGRGRENAKEALSLAEQRGFDPSTVRVSTALGGFLIPLGDSVVESEEADVIETIPGTENEPPVVLEAKEIPELPDPNKATVAEIEQFGIDHFPGLELTGTKAEQVAQMQAVIEAAPALTDNSGDAVADQTEED